MGVSRDAGALVVLWLMALVAVNHVEAFHLTPHYYDYSCPQIFSIVKAEIKKAVKEEKRNAASVVRLHFHDCFVNGCDASLLLDNTTEFVSEQFSRSNVNSIRGFPVIDSIKTALEEACPGVVSCADILAIAYRDSAVEVGLIPEYPVLFGRLDSLASYIDLADLRLPPPNLNFTKLKENFANVTLDELDLIALSGAHTFGRAQCKAIIFSGILNDSESNAGFQKKLAKLCPKDGLGNVTADLDFKTPDKFDNNYYKNLRKFKGTLHSDLTLQTTPGPNVAMVKYFAQNQQAFFAQFIKSSIKMGNLLPPLGTPGEVRRNCHVVNPKPLIASE